MKPEQLVEELQRALGPRLRSVVLYGSAAAGDHVGKRSDYNILVVVDRLGVEELVAVSRCSEQWRRSGNPAPLFFTTDQLRRSADVFPIELMDIQASHRTLYGSDAVEPIEVHDHHLRFVVERELKTTLIRLRDAFLVTGGKSRRVTDLMIESLSTVLVLFRAALRLFEGAAPAQKLEALRALGKHIQFDEGVLLEIERLKEGRLDANNVDALELFDRYLRTIELVADRIDDFVHQEI